MADNPDVVHDEHQAAAQPPESVPPAPDAPQEPGVPNDIAFRVESAPPEVERIEAETPGMEVAQSGIGDGTESCKICELIIEEGDPYLRAAYGPVHLEPCSHQGYVSLVEGTELSQGNE